MKKIFTAVLAAGFMSAPAFASELEEHCNAVADDPSGCSCLADTASGDVAEELQGVQGEEDLEALSEDAKAAIQACWPE